MSQGYMYTFQVQGCMADAPTVCGTAQIGIELLDEPLVATISGGDRAVGESDAMTLNACDASGDPDEPTAQCVGTACGSLTFTWACQVVQTAQQIADGAAVEECGSTVTATTVTPPATSSCEW